MKLRPFELGLVVVFAVFALVAILMLSMYEPSGSEDDPLQQIGQVQVWGTLPDAEMQAFLSEMTEEREAYGNVSYRYVPAEDFLRTMQAALADQEGPDLIITSQELLVSMRRRIQPYTADEVDVRNTYIDGAQIFYLSDNGVRSMYGYPIAVDPLMMYWNRDMLSNEGMLEPPQSWEVLVNTAFPALIERDFNRTITSSVVAMGEYANIRNAFGILSALTLQGGSQMVTEGKRDPYVVRLQTGESGDPFMSALDFFTRFGKPDNTLYSWNRALPGDRQQFAAEKLAFYFGYASEGRQIERINPNFNFSIAEFPQGAAATKRRTYGKFYAVSLLRTSDNVNGANTLLIDLISSTVSERLAKKVNMVPVFRSLVTAGSNDLYGRAAYTAAPITYGWLNPNRDDTDAILSQAIQDIKENRAAVSDVSNDAVVQISSSY